MRHDHNVSLTRFWFVFDLEGHRPPAPAPATTNVDGETVQYQSLSWGAGVIGYDEVNALALFRDVVGADLLPRIRTVTDVDADRAAIGIPDFLVVGNAAWRGFPPDNLRGPTR